MLSFSSSLSPDNKGIVVFVSENYDYKDKNDILPKNTITKIDSFISVLKVKKEKDQISSFDISEKQKCFIIKVKNKYEKYFPQESGGKFFSNLAKFKDIKSIAFYIDSLNFDKVKLVDFMIATEGEMRKVNWSTRREIVGSTILVILLTLFIALFCKIADLVFSTFFQWMYVLQTS